MVGKKAAVFGTYSSVTQAELAVDALVNGGSLRYLRANRPREGDSRANQRHRYRVGW